MANAITWGHEEDCCEDQPPLHGKGYVQHELDAKFYYDFFTIYLFIINYCDYYFLFIISTIPPQKKEI